MQLPEVQGPPRPLLEQEVTPLPYPVKKTTQLALDAQPEPAQPRLLSAEPTIESLVKSLCHGLPSMGLFSDEGGQFLGGSTMSKDNMIKAITHLSTLWDGSPIDRSRAMAGKVCVPMIAASACT